MYDINLWHTDMQEKSTLTIYKKYKHSIKDEQNLYDNSAGTTTLFEARTGTLQLNDTKRLGWLALHLKVGSEID